MTHVFLLDAGQDQGVSLTGLLNQLRIRYQKRITTPMETASAWWIQRKLFGWALVDIALQTYSGISLTECEIECNDHGKPEIRNFPDLHYNLSHTGSIFLTAISPYPVGVDVEKERKISPNLTGKVFTETEQKSLPDPRNSSFQDAFLRIWTKKESYTKMLGIGYQGDWHQIETHASIAPYNWKTMHWGRFLFSLCYYQTEILLIHPLLSLRELAEFYPETVQS